MSNRVANFRENFSPADGIGVGVAIVLTLIFVFGVLTPLSMREHQSASRAQAAALQRQRLNQVQSNVMRLTSTIADTRAQLALSGMQLQPVSALNKRLAVLVALARDCGVAIDDVKPAASTRTPQFIAVPILVHGRGDFSSTARFIHQLHDHVPDIGLDTFKLLGQPEDSSAASTFEFQLRWLASPDAGPAIASSTNE